MLNYAVEPDLLRPFVPAGTQLDFWRGVAYVSVVGFLFDDTRVLGVPVPLHRRFEEVNLRFYVRREVGGEVRRGVTFIREIVPRAAIAIVARLAYNEPYRALPMRHRIDVPSESGGPATVAYEWRDSSRWQGVHLTAQGAASAISADSEEEFIAHHSWGYTRQRDGSTVEYEVRHPRWNIWQAQTAWLEGGAATVYPPQLSAVLSKPPRSAFLADGSAVTVHTPFAFS